MSNIRLPMGVRDFLPRAARRRLDIAEGLLGTFESWGYQRIITPLFECADVLELGLGHEAKRTAIRFIEPKSGEVVALRPDITPQIARIAATRMANIEGPIRLCYEGVVARMGLGARGQREVLQAGVELMGVSGPQADAELLALAAAALDTRPHAKASLDLGHVALAQFALAEVADPNVREELAYCLRRKDRHGVCKAAAGQPNQRILEALPLLFGDFESVMTAADKLPLPESVKASLAELRQCVELAIAMGGESSLLESITLDLGEVRRLAYYTGIQINAYVEGAGAPVLSGGRYNDLMSRYGRPSAATGFAMDLESMAQAESASGQTTLRNGLLIAANQEQQHWAIPLAAVLRNAGFTVASRMGGPQSPEALLAYALSVDLPLLLNLQSTPCYLGSAKNQVAIDENILQRAASGQPDELVNILSERVQ